MKQIKLTHDQIEDLRRSGCTFTRNFCYWIVCDDTNIVNRVTRSEFMERSIAEPLRGVEQVRVYERGSK